MAVRGCYCSQCESDRRRHRSSGDHVAIERAEELLRGFLTPEQLEDWLYHGAFNVRGADKKLYRIVGRSHSYRLSQVVDNGGTATNVWLSDPTICAQIPADNALGLMFYLANDPHMVYRSGCHEASMTLPHDYDGKL